jgi:hypothetical protein
LQRRSIMWAGQTKFPGPVWQALPCLTLATAVQRMHSILLCMARSFEICSMFRTSLYIRFNWAIPNELALVYLMCIIFILFLTCYNRCYSSDDGWIVLINRLPTSFVSLPHKKILIQNLFSISFHFTIALNWLEKSSF